MVIFMDNEIKNVLLNNFLRVAKIPRESGHEEKIVDFFCNVAKNKNLYCFKDKYNNVLIKKKGNITGDVIALQAHLDMVCVKRENSKHNFLNEGIEVVVDGDKVSAKNTTLGADQGVGLAMMLTIMEDDSLNHPDLEFMFTSEEETTFDGAVNFPYEKIESKRIINLDNCDDDTIFIGADGDVCNKYVFEGILEKIDLPSYKIVLEGFPGGNSGVDIELAKNNAISKMAQILDGKDVFIGSINGGTFENDLATSCEVVINTNIDVDKLFEGYDVKIEKILNDKTFSREGTDKIIKEILDLPCGYVLDHLGSANLGVIETKDNMVKIYYVFRSMDEDVLDKINDMSRNLNNGFVVNEVYTDPIWKVDDASELLFKYRDLYYKECGEYPKNVIWHGAIECASLKKRISGVDIISVGAKIRKHHTVEEVTYISSWIKVYKLLIKFLEKIND